MGGRSRVNEMPNCRASDWCRMAKAIARSIGVRGATEKRTRKPCNIDEQRLERDDRARPHSAAGSDVKRVSAKILDDRNSRASIAASGVKSLFRLPLKGPPLPRLVVTVPCPQTARPSGYKGARKRGSLRRTLVARPALAVAISPDPSLLTRRWAKAARTENASPKNRDAPQRPRHVRKIPLCTDRARLPHYRKRLGSDRNFPLGAGAGPIN